MKVMFSPTSWQTGASALQAAAEALNDVLSSMQSGVVDGCTVVDGRARIGLNAVMSKARRAVTAVAAVPAMESGNMDAIAAAYAAVEQRNELIAGSFSCG